MTNSKETNTRDRLGKDWDKLTIETKWYKGRYRRDGSSKAERLTRSRMMRQTNDSDHTEERLLPTPNQ